MLDTSTRLLRLLAVLQSRQHWAGTDLADRLEIAPRTLRRDIDRLRSLGYAITADAGPGGGYRLGRGADLPPLLLDDDEAVAIAVSLRSATDAFIGLSEIAVRALVKLDQLLPARLRPRVTLRYRDRVRRDSTRTVEPWRLAHTASRRWYLVAWDLGRSDWRTLRVDRIVGSLEIGVPFVPRPPPPDVAQYVSDALTNMPSRYRARFKLAESAAAVLQRMPEWIGWVTPVDADHCIFIAGADSFDGLLGKVLLSGADFEILDPPELRAHLPELAKRLLREAT